jgi:hypothetical protein
MPPEPSDPEKSWKRALTLSAGVHVLILLIVVFGLPFLPQREFDTPMPIGIEVMDVSEVAQTTKPEASSTKAEKQVDTPTPPVPPKVQEKPKPPSEPKPKPEPEKPKEEPPKPPPQSDLSDQPPEEKPVEKPEPKPEPPKEEKPKEEPKKDEPDTQEEDFEAVLKNLSPEETTAEKPAEENLMTQSPVQEEASSGTIGDRITMSEMDALRRQLAQCWSILAGAEGAQDLVIEVRMQVNADRTVQSAEIVDQMRYNSDEIFRSAADSAMRAVRNPMCNPLNLPPEKYDQWKSIKVRFDPREMF